MLCCTKYCGWNSAWLGMLLVLLLQMECMYCWFDGNMCLTSCCAASIWLTDRLIWLSILSAQILIDVFSDNKHDITFNHYYSWPILSLCVYSQLLFHFCFRESQHTTHRISLVKMPLSFRSSCWRRYTLTALEQLHSLSTVHVLVHGTIQHQSIQDCYWWSDWVWTETSLLCHQL